MCLMTVHAGASGCDHGTSKAFPAYLLLDNQRIHSKPGGLFMAWMAQAQTTGLQQNNQAVHTGLTANELEV